MCHSDVDKNTFWATNQQWQIYKLKRKFMQTCCVVTCAARPSHLCFCVRCICIYTASFCFRVSLSFGHKRAGKFPSSVTFPFEYTHAHKRHVHTFTHSCTHPRPEHLTAQRPSIESQCRHMNHCVLHLTLFTRSDSCRHA